MLNTIYPYLITYLDLPERIEYEFRTQNNVLYSCYFILNPFTDGDLIYNAYEFGLTDVEENYINRIIDFSIKNTVVSIFSDFLSRTKNIFFITIHFNSYS